jgi:hypothetical protein
LVSGGGSYLALRLARQALVNPQKSALPGPACCVLRALTEDWSAQARVISLHGDPFILCAAVMFQVRREM